MTVSLGNKGKGEIKDYSILSIEYDGPFIEMEYTGLEYEPTSPRS